MNKLIKSVFSAHKTQSVVAARTFSTSQDPASAELLSKIKDLGTQAAVDALWLNGYPQPQICGSRALTEGMKMVGNAVTVRFVPHRPDLLLDKPKGEDSAEYKAFEMCGPDQVLVMASTGPWESVGGDVKFLRLAQRKVGGYDDLVLFDMFTLFLTTTTTTTTRRLVTDGSVRDTHILRKYGFPVFSHSTTAKQGPAVMQPWGLNEVIECGGVTVRPNDIILGDDDGVVVIPRSMAETVVRVASEREKIESLIRDELERNPGSPGKYYPFKQPVDPNTPLGELISRHGKKYE